MQNETPAEQKNAKLKPAYEKWRLAYDTALLIGRLFNHRKADAFSAEDILAAIESVDPGKGALGKYRFVADERVGKYFHYELEVFKVGGK